MIFHTLKRLSMACSIMYAILAFAVLAVSISWRGDGVQTAPVDLDYGHVLEVIIVLGIVLAIVGFVGCVGSLNDKFGMVVGPTAGVLLVAVGFAAISGFLSTRLARAESDLRMDMTREIAMYLLGDNEYVQDFFHKK